MIGKRELLDIAGTASLLPNIVEKDYALGWALAGIFTHEELADSWVFKGGTCLKKCYFETYRFSEDLDFTLLDASHLQEDFLRRVFGEISEWIYEQSGIEFPVDLQNFDIYDNPRGNPNCQGRLGYRGPISPSSDPACHNAACMDHLVRVGRGYSIGRRLCQADIEPHIRPLNAPRAGDAELGLRVAGGKRSHGADRVAPCGIRPSST